MLKQVLLTQSDLIKQAIASKVDPLIAKISALEIENGVTGGARRFTDETSACDRATAATW